MKKLSTIVLMLALLMSGGFLVRNYLSKKEIQEMEGSLFPLIRDHKVAGNLACTPVFVTFREEELFIYCEPVDKSDPAMVDKLRTDIIKIANDWALASERRTKYIQTRFTDEISPPPKK